MTTKNKLFTRGQLEAIIDAFLNRVAVPEMPGCPLYTSDNGNNLWFKATDDKRKLPALLAVRTELDGAISYRESASEGQMTANNTNGFVDRGELKRYLVNGCRIRKLMAGPVFKLTAQKAHGETLARALDLGAWDSL